MQQLFYCFTLFFFLDKKHRQTLLLHLSINLLVSGRAETMDHFSLLLCLCLFVFRLKADLAYNYKGPRTKDDIVEFANRVAG